MLSYCITEAWALILPFFFFLLSGIAFNLLTVDGPKPWWSFGARDCSYVQDRQEQVWDHCKELDPEVCHGLVLLLGLCEEGFFPFGIDHLIRRMNGIVVICSSHKWTKKGEFSALRTQLLWIVMQNLSYDYETHLSLVSDTLWNEITSILVSDTLYINSLQWI